MRWELNPVLLTTEPFLFVIVFNPWIINHKYLSIYYVFMILKIQVSFSKLISLKNIIECMRMFGGQRTTLWNSGIEL